MKYKFSVACLVLCLLVSDELFASVIYVNKAATGSGKGSSWANAYTNLQDALAAAKAKDEIWVAAGIYVPGKNRTDAFRLKPGVALYGGFNGTEKAVNQRDWAANLTVLSGDVLGNDAAFANNSENVYHVVRGADKAILDGFVITGGNADGVGADSFGGGMYNVGVRPTVRNCIFFGNAAATWGGGALCNSAASPVVQGCVFFGNSGGFGAAMRNHDASSPEVRNCIFSGNSTTAAGCAAAMYNDHSSPLVESSIFSGHSAFTGGGAIYNNVSSPTLRNCVFAGNTALAGYNLGCAIDNQWSSSPILENCTFAANRAEIFGSTMHTGRKSRPTIRNCIFWGPLPQYGVLIDQTDEAMSVFSCDIEGGCIGPLVHSAGEINNVGNINADPKFVGGPSGTWTRNATYDAKTLQSTFTDTQASWTPGALKGKFVMPDAAGVLQYVIAANSATTLAVWGDMSATALNGKPYEIHDYHLQKGSPCIDAGTAVPGVTTDLHGTPRPSDGNGDGKAATDIGAYEFVE